MKQILFPLRALAVALLLLLLMQASGCIGPLKFQVVDADSHKPLSGVRVQVESTNPYWFDFAPASSRYAPTGNDGRVSTGILRSDFQNVFFFEKDGYKRAYGLLSGKEFAIYVRSVVVGTLPIAPSATRPTGPFNSIEEMQSEYETIHPDAAGVIVVPMHRAYTFP